MPSVLDLVQCATVALRGGAFIEESGEKPMRGMVRLLSMRGEWACSTWWSIVRGSASQCYTGLAICGLWGEPVGVDF